MIQQCKKNRENLQISLRLQWAPLLGCGCIRSNTVYGERVYVILCLGFGFNTESREVRPVIKSVAEIRVY